MLEMLARSLLAELWIAQTLVASYAIACRALPRAPFALRATGVAVGGVTLATLGFHLLAALGFFAIPAATVGTTVVAIAAWSMVGPARIRASWTHDRRLFARLWRRLRRSPRRGVVVGFTILALPVVLRALVVPPLAWDSLTYHAVKGALWVQHAGALPMHGPGTWSYYPLMWGGGEVLTSWAMLPFHGDDLALAMEVVQWLALGVATIALAREIGIREPHASTLAAFVLSIPTLRISVGSGYVETISLLLLLSGWALAARFIEHGVVGAFHLALAAFGVAAGIKVPLLAVSLSSVAILLAALVFRWSSERARLGHAAAGVALFTSLVAPWPWAAIRETGLPFSPLPMTVLGQRLGAPSPEVEWYVSERPEAERPTESDTTLLARALLQEQMGPGPTTLLAASLALIAWPLLGRRHRVALAMLAIGAAVTTAEYLSPGFVTVRRYFSTSGVRFLLPTLVAATVVGGALGRARPAIARGFALALLAGAAFQMILYASYGASSTSAGAVGCVVLGALVAGLLVSKITHANVALPVRFAGVALTGAFALIALRAVRDGVRPELFADEFAIHPIHAYWATAAAAVDDDTSPRRIAITSGPEQDLDNWLAYPFFGRRLRNEVFYVSPARDGGLHHFGAGTRNLDFVRAADFESWWRALHRHGVTHVMSFRPASIELLWMETRPELFGRVAGAEGEWGLFELRAVSLD